MRIHSPGNDSAARAAEANAVRLAEERERLAGAICGTIEAGIVGAGIRGTSVQWISFERIERLSTRLARRLLVPRRGDA